MSPSLVIFRKETRSALLRPSTWGVFASTTAVLGIIYFLALRDFPSQTLEIAPLFSMCLLLTVPIPVSFFTMSLFPRERTTGSLELLLTAPVTDAEVVTGKFLSALFLSIAALLLTYIALAIHLNLSEQLIRPHLITLCGGFVGAFLATATLCAFGTLISLATNYEAAAGAVTMLFSILIVSIVVESELGTGVAAIADNVNVLNFAHGILDSRPFITFLSTTLFFLFAAVRFLESRRWASASR
ncbi:MAG: ABC transporter permease [Kiritimatiellia bacterium]